MAKKIYILFLLLLIDLQISFAANTVTINDANFRSFLQTTYGSPTIISDQLDTNQAALKTGTLNCRGKAISDIYGIQFFKNITILNVNRNNLISLPALNGFTSLQKLYCDSNLLTSLPNLNHITSLTFISCRVNALTNLPPLTGLTSLTYIGCSNNDIAQLPDLAGLSSLMFLECAENELTSLPASLSTLTNLENLFIGANHLTSIPSLSSLTKLQMILGSDNLLTSIPVSANNSLLKFLRISNNKITQLPDLSFISAPVIVYVDHNNLTFEDLLPVINNSNYISNPSKFLLFPQNKFGSYADTLINVNTNGTFTFDLGVDPASSLGSNQNSYQWYKNGTLIFTGSLNSFSKATITMADSGNYYVVVKNNNPVFVNDSIVSNSKKLKTEEECLLISNLSYTSSTISCSEGFKVTIDPGSISGGTSPYMYVMTNLANNNSVMASVPVLSGIKEGEYSIIIRDAKNCESTPVVGQFVLAENCDPVFSPNGDGVSDTYYISTPGNAKIFNKSGQLVHELNTPAYWDGLDKGGQEVPAGYYAIIINGKTAANISLMR